MYLKCVSLAGSGAGGHEIAYVLEGDTFMPKIMIDVNKLGPRITSFKALTGLDPRPLVWKMLQRNGPVQVISLMNGEKSTLNMKTAIRYFSSYEELRSIGIPALKDKVDLLLVPSYADTCDVDAIYVKGGRPYFLQNTLYPASAGRKCTLDGRGLAAAAIALGWDETRGSPSGWGSDVIQLLFIIPARDESFYRIDEAREMSSLKGISLGEPSPLRTYMDGPEPALVPIADITTACVTALHAYTHQSVLRLLVDVSLYEMQELLSKPHQPCKS
jgi:hypothetical protein